MSLRQASSLPTGAHAIFQKYAIQAITLQTLDQENSSAYLTITLSQLAGVLEGVVRSLNNLLERFNRSYWFYLLASTRRYISIGIYMIPFALLSSAILLRVIRLVYCWSDLSSTSKLANRQNDLWPAISFAFVCHLLGLSLACVPFLIQNWINSNQTSASSIESTSSINPWPIEDVLFYTIMCFCISCMHNPLYDLNPLRRRQRRSSLIVLLLNVLLVFGALSLLNFSLAVLLTAIHLPFLLLMPADSPVTLSRKLVDATIKLASILIHPISLTFICALISSWQHDSDDSIRGHLQRSVYGLKRIILFTVEDWYIHDNWMFALVTTGLFPIWLQFWNLV